MPLKHHVICVVTLASTLGCTRSDRPAGADSSNTVARSVGAPAAALIPLFVGCYELGVDSGQVYQVYLTRSRLGPVAMRYGQDSRNAPGDHWSWTPIDSTRFRLEWGGIDSAMEFTVVRDTSGYAASGLLRRFHGRPDSTDLHPTVRSIECPSLNSRRDR